MSRGSHSRKVRLRRTISVLVLAGLALSALLAWSLSSGPHSTASTTGSTRHTRPASAGGRIATSPSTTSAPTTTATDGSRADPFDSARSYAAGRAGTIVAAVYDLTSDQQWTLGPPSREDEASVVKVDILEALLAQSKGSGLSQDNQSLAMEMIEYSTNDAATDLWNAVGGSSGIAAFNTSIDLTDTDPSSCVTCPGFPWPGWGLTTTNSTDQIDLLKRLVDPNPVLTDAERSDALELMEHVTPSQSWGISAGIPSGVTIALKNGWLPLSETDTDWQVNSIGWVSGLGRNYLIAVLTTGDPSEQYGIDSIEQISTDVWTGLG